MEYKLLRQVNSMFCRKCGQELHITDTVCPNCKSLVFSQSQECNRDVIKENKILDLNLGEEHINRPQIPDFYKKSSRRKRAHYAKTGKAFKEVAATKSDDYDNMEEGQMEIPVKRKRMKSLFIGLAVAIVLIFTCLFSAYYAYNRIVGSSTEEYVKSVSQVHGQIEAINKDLFALFENSGESPPVEDILAKIKDSYGSLNDVIESASGITAPSNYWDSNTRLQEALEQNKQIFKQLELILDNPASPDAQQNLEMLAQYIDQCMTNYTAVSIDDLSFALPNEALSVPQKLQPWIDQKQAEYAQVMALIEKFRAYFDSMSSIFVTYDKAETNFAQLLKSVRNGAESWDTLFNKIEESEAIIQSATTEYGKIAVPSQLKSFNKKFGSILDNLNAYYRELKLAASTEMEFSSFNLTPEEMTLVQEEINKLYKDAEEYKTSSLQEYQKFASDMKIEKDKYLDPEYVIKLTSGK